uniref:Histone acetyltransferase type B catalytic subunit n=1 Tax=Panagrellus redivivus TaxID=6233 RepID=A0A7E4ZYT8_PANRE
MSHSGTHDSPKQPLAKRPQQQTTEKTFRAAVSKRPTSFCRPRSQPFPKMATAGTKKEKRAYLRFERLFKSALRTDVDDLLREFSKGPQTYDGFMQVYNAVDFWMVAIGRINLAEEYEFVEDFFRYTSAYMFPVEMRKNAHDHTLGNSASDEDTAATEQLFGIYLCYTAFFMQPQNDVKLIYIKLEMADYLSKIMEDLTMQRQLHAVFCLQRLITSKAFAIVPFLEDYNPFLVKRFNVESVRNEIALEFEEFERLQLVTKAQDLTLVSELHKKYTELKDKLKVPSSLKQVTENVGAAIADFEKEAHGHMAKAVEYANKGRKGSSFLDKVSATKRKAVEADIHVSRHRRHVFGLGMEGYENALMAIDNGDGSDEPSTSAEPSPTKKPGRPAKQKAKVDKIQQRAKLAVGLAKGKTARIRRDTIGEEVTDAEITRREVESDVAHAIELSARRRTRNSHRTESQSLRESVSRSPTKRRPKGPKVVEGVLLPNAEEASGVMKKALLELDKHDDTDRALDKLKKLK